MTTGLSEWGSGFFSDNLVSNESSYLHVAEALERLPKGLAYLGVGPEQNFSYLAILQPSLAFVVDLRRANFLQHLLYKALFEEASTRSQWLADLLGRDLDPSSEPRGEAPLEAVLAHVERRAPDAAAFERAHERVVGRLDGLRVLSGRADRRALERLHRCFFERQLDITFELHRPGRHGYPSLRRQLLGRSAAGRALGFLASHELYARVRGMQLEHRVVPVVGDFTGHHALRSIGTLLRRRGLPLGVLYASNVEQFVFEERRWARWIGNLEALPAAPDAALLRCYVDQGRAHPRQLPGHRMTSLLQPVSAFLARERSHGHRDYWDVVSELGR